MLKRRYIIGIIILYIILFIPLAFAADNAGFWVRPQVNSQDIFNSICNVTNSIPYSHNNIWECASFNGTDFNVTINTNTIININESDPNAWLQYANQIGLTGDKSGSYDLTTTGTGIFGDDYQAILGDDGNTRSGRFTAGSSYANIITTTEAGKFSYAGGTYETILASSSFAGYFADAGNSVYLGDGTYSINADGDSYFDGDITATEQGTFGSLSGNYATLGHPTNGGVYGYSNLGYAVAGYSSSGSASGYFIHGSGNYGQIGTYDYGVYGYANSGSAGQFDDGSNSVSLSDGTYAIDMTGDMRLEGDLIFYSGYLNDASDIESINPHSRYLYASDGTTRILDWSNDGTADFGDNDIITTEQVKADEFRIADTSRLKILSSVTTLVDETTDSMRPLQAGYFLANYYQSNINNGLLKTRQSTSGTLTFQGYKTSSFVDVAKITSHTTNPTFDIAYGRLTGDLNGQTYNINTTGAGTFGKLNITGKFNSNNLSGTGNAYVCVDSTGTIYRSLTACI